MTDDNVDVDEFCTMGQKMIDKLLGQPVFTYSFKRNDKAKTLGDASAVKVTAEKSIDPALLFQRLIVFSRAGCLSLEGFLKHKLSTFPAALFEANCVFRKRGKNNWRELLGNMQMHSVIRLCLMIVLRLIIMC